MISVILLIEIILIRMKIIYKKLFKIDYFGTAHMENQIKQLWYELSKEKR